MSVINRMLTELDARQAQAPAALVDQGFSQAVSETFRTTASMAQVQPLRRRTRALVMLACGAAVTGVYLRWTAPEQEAPVKPLDLSSLEAPSAGIEAARVSPRPVRDSALRAHAAASAAARTEPPVQLAAAVMAVQPVAAATQAIVSDAEPPRTPLPAVAAATPVTPAPDVAPAPSPAPASAQPPAPTPPRDSVDAPTAAIEKKLVALSAPQRAAAAYKQAMDLATTGHNSLAIDKALEVLKADADHVSARQLAAALMMEKSRFEEAGTLLRDGLARKPGQPQWVVLLARLKADTGDAAGALATLAQTSQLGPDGHGLRAVILARQARYAEALPAYEAALRLAPENASWWLGLGVALDAEGQPAQARQAYQRARAIGTLSAELTAFVDQKLNTLN